MDISFSFLRRSYAERRRVFGLSGSSRDLLDSIAGSLSVFVAHHINLSSRFRIINS